MGQLPDLQEARRRLGLALSSVCHDRWVLGYLRNGSLQPIAASEVSRRFMQKRPLMPLSRRSLYEKRRLVINSVFEKPHANEYDWELDWPPLLRPVGTGAPPCHPPRSPARETPRQRRHQEAAVGRSRRPHVPNRPTEAPGLPPVTW